MAKKVLNSYFGGPMNLALQRYTLFRVLNSLDWTNEEIDLFVENCVDFDPNLHFPENMQIALDKRNEYVRAY